MINANPLPRAVPETMGVSSRAVLDLIRKMDGKRNEVHGFMLERDGVVIAESWLAPYKPEYPHTCHSLGKSYTCTAIGLAVTKGLMSVEDKIVDLFKDEIALFDIEPDDLYKTLRVRDVMCMGDGMESMPMLNAFWLENYLRTPLKYTPGTHFMYNTTASCVLGAVVQKVTGMDVYDFLNRELFQKIGIGKDDLIWLKFQNGIRAEPGISATTESNLRLGRFYLEDGRANGEQIVRAEWIREATSAHISESPAFDRTTTGYGWQLWIGNHPGQFRFDGGQGQLMIADRTSNAICAYHQGGWHPEGCTSTNETVQQFLQELGPIEPLPEDPEGYAALVAYLQNRCLPDNESAPVPANAKKWEGVYAVTDGHPYFWLEVSPGPADFYHNFYDVSRKRETDTIAFRFEGDHTLLMTINDRSVYRLRLDGKLETAVTEGVIPGLDKTCATALFEDENTLVVRIRYLNGWSTSVSRFVLDGANLSITVDKDMLHEGREPVRQTGTARRMF